MGLARLDDRILPLSRSLAHSSLPSSCIEQVSRATRVVVTIIPVHDGAAALQHASLPHSKPAIAAPSSRLPLFRIRYLRPPSSPLFHCGPESEPHLPASYLLDKSRCMDWILLSRTVGQLSLLQLAWSCFSCGVPHALVFYYIAIDSTVNLSQGSSLTFSVS